MESEGNNDASQGYFDSFMFSSWEHKSKLDRDSNDKTSPGLYLDEELPNAGAVSHFITDNKQDSSDLNQSGTSDICSADGFLIEVTIEEEPNDRNIAKLSENVPASVCDSESKMSLSGVGEDSDEYVLDQSSTEESDEDEEDDRVPNQDRKWCSRTSTREHILLQEGKEYSLRKEGEPAKKRRKTKQNSARAKTKQSTTVVSNFGGDGNGSYARREVATDLEPHSMTLKKLMSLTSSKGATVDWLMNYGFLPNERRCPKCYKKMDLQTVPKTVTSDERKWRCRTNVPFKHDTRISIRHGTWFSNSNLTLGEILEITYLWTLGLTHSQIQREMGTSSATNVDWANFCREVCEEKLIQETKAGNRIGGNGVVVELDEWKLANRKSSKVRQGWVLAGRERDNKQKCFMVMLSDQSTDTLLDTIEMYVSPGSYIQCDSWKAQERLGSSAYHYLTTHHNVTFIITDSQKSKINMQTASFGVRQKYLSGYLAVMIWRQRNEGQNLFSVFMKDISDLYNGNCDVASCNKCIR